MLEKNALKTSNGFKFQVQENLFNVNQVKNFFIVNFFALDSHDNKTLNSLL
jgi:hypothetical protein